MGRHTEEIEEQNHEQPYNDPEQKIFYPGIHPAPPRHTVTLAYSLLEIK
jgi:hypothetical protein